MPWIIVLSLLRPATPLGWEPDTTLKAGLEKTYRWIEQQYRDRKAGKATVS